MNKGAYEKLPADLKKVIDDNSGIEAAAMLGRAMDQGDVEGREIAERQATRSSRWTSTRPSAGAGRLPPWRPTGWPR